MKFQVPQFIEVEDKIFGPLSLKQFIYLAGGVGFGALLYKLLPVFFAILIGLPVFVFAVALAFYKPNGRSFIKVVESAFYYFLKDKLYTWKKIKKGVKKETEGVKINSTETVPAPDLTRNKLKDLAWSLDVKESIYPE